MNQETPQSKPDGNPPSTGQRIAVPASDKPAGSPLPADRPQRTTAAALAFLLGFFAVHKWYTGRRDAALLHSIPLLCFPVGGLVLIASTVIGLPCPCVCMIGPLAMFMIPVSVAEAIIYLNITDEEFHQRYVIEKRAWF